MERESTKDGKITIDTETLVFYDSGDGLRYWKPINSDVELTAIQVIVGQLKQLNREQRRRVMQYLISRFYTNEEEKTDERRESQ